MMVWKVEYVPPSGQVYVKLELVEANKVVSACGGFLDSDETDRLFQELSLARRRQRRKSK